jgi:hypothetical protein
MFPQAEALFASTLQRADTPTPDAVAEAIRSVVCRLGTTGCAALMAQEFGDHPEQAAERMRWARQLAGRQPATPPAMPHERRQAAVAKGRPRGSLLNGFAADRRTPAQASYRRAR